MEEGMDAMFTYMMLMAVILTVIICAQHVADAQQSWGEGFEDHARLMQLYEMSPDDDALLAELRIALKSHIKTAGLYRKGDSGRIDKTTDWSDFKNLAWELTVLRRETGR
jgi:hypothetical protein